MQALCKKELGDGVKEFSINSDFRVLNRTDFSDVCGPCHAAA
jgi:hypothetical protein